MSGQEAGGSTGLPQPVRCALSTAVYDGWSLPGGGVRLSPGGTCSNNGIGIELQVECEICKVSGSSDCGSTEHVLCDARIKIY